MRYKQSIAKWLSIVMMIVLAQKVAGGLYLHNWLHDSKQFSSISHHPAALSQANCTCIDDFYIPFTEPVILHADSPFLSHENYFAVFRFVLPVVPKYFHSLRAPPLSISFSS